MVAELEDACILINEKKLSSLQPLLPVLEAVIQARRVAVIKVGGATQVEVKEHKERVEVPCAPGERRSKKPAACRGAASRSCEPQPSSEDSTLKTKTKRPAYGFGYNAQTGEYGDLTSQGIIVAQADRGRPRRLSG